MDENIFKARLDASSVMQAKRAYDAGAAAPLASCSDPFVAASVLKLYLSSLPGLYLKPSQRTSPFESLYRNCKVCTMLPKTKKKTF